jgi:hypothetical protein
MHANVGGDTHDLGIVQLLQSLLESSAKNYQELWIVN